MFIGFDYGTANCSVAVMTEDTPRLLPLEGDSPFMASMLSAPTREAVSEYLHRFWHLPTGSDENQLLLTRAASRYITTACNSAVRPWPAISPIPKTAIL